MSDAIVENVTEAVQNASANTKIPASPHGMAIAYLSLLVMALVPIYFGSFRAVRFIKQQKDKGEKLERVSRKDAMLFPFIASIALFSLYIIYKLVPKEYITVLLLSYFFIIGVFALAHILNPYIIKLIPETRYLANLPYHLFMTRGENAEKEELIKADFCTFDIVGVGICGLFGLLHLYTKHWATNNLFGLAFCLNGIELIHLASFKTGAMLLGGLFFYDIFWVFKTDVMVTVAKNVEAPIKLMFPQDLLEKGIFADNCAMLGLGDIVIPGVLIALLLRFDISMNKPSRPYFHATYIAYILGLCVTIFVMHVFKHAQPALLYLVPACLGVPCLLALVKGELGQLINYDEEPAEEEPAEEAKKEN